MFDRTAERAADEAAVRIMQSPASQTTLRPLQPGQSQFGGNAGQALDAGTQSFMQARFGADFSQIRTHTDAAAARRCEALGAQAFTWRNHISFGKHQQPGVNALTAHELAHAVQQGGGGPGLAAQAPALQCKLQFRELDALLQAMLLKRNPRLNFISAWARRQELAQRLNQLNPGLQYDASGNQLRYQLQPGARLDGFDQFMMEQIDRAAVTPLVLIGGHRLSMVDSYQFGLVDLDDLLASDAQGLRFVLLHFLRERAAPLPAQGAAAAEEYAAILGAERLQSIYYNDAHHAGIQQELMYYRQTLLDPSLVELPIAHGRNRARNRFLRIHRSQSFGYRLRFEAHQVRDHAVRGIQSSISFPRTLSRARIKQSLRQMLGEHAPALQQTLLRGAQVPLQEYIQARQAATGLAPIESRQEPNPQPLPDDIGHGEADFQLP
ncbi:DUF4157 domain-containing protein [Massilia sp. W12]|uniref:eCIS core domain-containing protein n=1 Tax=Massilia sp. W12 TaxID=3126507 RepID=UPI0030D0AD15